MDRKKEAARRVLKAADILYIVNETLEQAQAQISVIGTGLNQNYSKIGKIRESVKDQLYDLRRCHESGLVDLDETSAILLSKPKGRKK